MVTRRKAGDDDSATAPGALPSMEDLAEVLEQFKVFGVDAGAFVERQRSDLEALADANRQAYDDMRELFERRTQAVRQLLEQWQQSLRGTDGDEMARQQAEVVRAGLLQAMDDFQELTRVQVAARDKAWKVLQDRMQENLDALHRFVQSGGQSS